MGRKIPAKKHRGVKDPLVQQARRLQSLKTKINAPPKDPDEQPVPRSVERLFAFQNEHSPRDKRKTGWKGDTNVSRHNKERNVRTSADNPVSRLRQLPGESGRGFSLRINSAVRALHGDVMDYPQDMEEEDNRGSRMAELREKRARKKRRATGGVLPARPDAQLSRTQKLALKKKAKKEKAEEKVTSRREVQYERVSFGDVTHAPPALSAPRGVTSSHAPRPGRRNLLLTALLQGGGETRVAGAERGARGKGALAPAEALRRERARLDAIRAYRDLKANKQKTNKHL